MSGNDNDEEEGPCTNGKQFDRHSIIFKSPHVDRLRTFEYRNHKAIGRKNPVAHHNNIELLSKMEGKR